MGLITVTGQPGCRPEEAARISAQRLGFSLISHTQLAASIDSQYSGSGPIPDKAYADQYGRCIHFLMSASRGLRDPSLLPLARSLADQAVIRLYENGWFQGTAGSHLYESVDGVGYLLLALIELETGKPVPTFAASF